MNVEKDSFNRSFDSLESLVDTISDMLQCPVTVVDANHRLMAYSSHDPHTDQAQITTIISRCIPKKVICSWLRGWILNFDQRSSPNF